MSRRVLGHSSHWIEEKEVPRVRIGNIRPGGIVDVILPDNPDPTLTAMPAKVYAVYTKHGGVADHAHITPESLMGAGGLVGAADVPPDSNSMTIKVPGVKPGDYDVQLVLEYADDEPPPAPPAPAAAPQAPPPTVKDSQVITAQDVGSVPADLTNATSPAPPAPPAT